MRESNQQGAPANNQQPNNFQQVPQLQHANIAQYPIPPIPMQPYPYNTALPTLPPVPIPPNPNNYTTRNPFARY